MKLIENTTKGDGQYKESAGNNEFLLQLFAFKFLWEIQNKKTKYVWQDTVIRPYLESIIWKYLPKNCTSSPENGWAFCRNIQREQQTKETENIKIIALEGQFLKDN